MKNIRSSYSHTYSISERSTIDFTLSENPLGPSPKVIRAIKVAAQQSHLYPEAEKQLVTAIAEHHKVSEDMILVGAGANQLLEDYLKVIGLGKNIVAPTATFPESIACVATLQGSVTHVPLHSTLELNTEGLLNACRIDTALIHLCNPNNPTGIWTSLSEVLSLAERSPVPVLISEAGADFVGETLIHPQLHPNLIIVRSFSKAYGLAGLRVGYSVASPKIITKMKGHLRSYRVSSLALIAAIAALKDQDHLKKSIAYVLREKVWLMGEMDDLGFHIPHSNGQNFVARVPTKFTDANDFCAIAKRHGVAVVNCSLYPGLDQYIRVSPQKHVINKNLIKILNKIMEN